MTEFAEDIDAWHTLAEDRTRGGPHLGRLIEAVRALQDAVVEATAPDDVTLNVAERLEQVVADLRPWAAGERDRSAGRRPDLPGRGHPLLLPFVVDNQDDEHIRGRVVFRQYHLGGHGAAHWCTISLSESLACSLSERVRVHPWSPPGHRQRRSTFEVQHEFREARRPRTPRLATGLCANERRSVSDRLRCPGTTGCLPADATARGQP